MKSWSVFKKVRANPQPLLLSMVFDFLFFGGFIGISLLLLKFLPVPGAPGFEAAVSEHRLILLLSFIGYFFVSILLYSFFKHLILHQASLYAKRAKRHAKRKISFDRFRQFFWLNTVIVIVFAAVFAIIVIFLGLTFKHQFLIAVRNIFLVIMFLLGYSLLNTLHTLFAHGKKAGKASKEALRIVFTTKKLFPILVSFVVAVVLAYGLQFLLDILIRALFFDVMSIAVPVYFWTLSTISVIIALLVLAFHRVYFYLSL